MKYWNKSGRPRQMVFDTNLILAHIRRNEWLPARAIISVVVVGELEALSLRSGWGARKTGFLQSILAAFPIVELSLPLTTVYARLDAYSQGKLPAKPLPAGMSARNMGKNDLWIAATALYFDMELHTADQDFDHLQELDLRVVRS